MLNHKRQPTTILALQFFAIFFFIFQSQTVAKDLPNATPGNFGLPGIIDLPTARHFSDGELVISQQVHKSLARIGISFQALPRVGLSFRYTGHGINGVEAYGRVNHDRSFDAHLTVIKESKYFPAISLGLRDFIGTGWYSSEYLVGTKSIGNFEFSTGLGFGRLARRNSFSNPFRALNSKFDYRDSKSFGRGGTLGTINWFRGETSLFYGGSYKFGEKVTFQAEYTTDTMSSESSYLDIKSHWNFGMSYQANDYVKLAAQYLHGSQVSLTAHVAANPSRPPMLGTELAPVPMRVRGSGAFPFLNNDEVTIRKVLTADRFQIKNFKISDDIVHIGVTNTKFRSTAQAIGRVASNLQRFSSDKVKVAYISLYSGDLQTSRYRVNLDEVGVEQFKPQTSSADQFPIKAISPIFAPITESTNKLSWGIGPYIAHRLFNPDLPLSMETGIQFTGSYRLSQGVKIDGTLRKSVLTNLTDNKRRSNSSLNRVHSDWPLYDINGQGGHIHELKLSLIRNLAPGLYGRAHAGFLEPFFAGIGGEILYKPAQLPLAFGIDIHRVRKREYNMLLGLRNYETTVGHFSIYYDAGGMFNLEINAGRYLAGDWGATTTVSRKFGSGWEVGGYATFTDVPFSQFGEGSFDKAIYVSVPIDWIISSPTQIKRRLTIRPITRDGGANLSSARNLYKQIRRSQNAEFQREFGRLWK